MATTSGWAGNARMGRARTDGVMRRADDSTFSNDMLEARPAVVVIGVSRYRSLAADRLLAIDFAMNSSTSLCRQVWPQRCFEPARRRRRKVHPLTRSSPACSNATYQ